MQEIQRVSVTDSIVSAIKELIESDEFSVDQKLPTEHELCEKMKVSRTSVREAIRALQALGYVRIVPGKGAFVNDYEKAKAQRANWYDSKDAKFYDYIEARMAVEVFAARLSVQRADAAQVRELGQIHALFAEADEQKDIVRMLMLDELFHEKIVAYTKNPLLMNINKQLTAQYRIYRGDSLTGPAQFYNALMAHAEILAAFEQGNAEEAALAMRRHLEKTMKDLPESKRFAGEQG